MNQNPRLIVGGMPQPEPLFKTREEQQEFYDGIYRQIKPAQDEYMIARAKSEDAARRHVVD